MFVASNNITSTSRDGSNIVLPKIGFSKSYIPGLKQPRNGFKL